MYHKQHLLYLGYKFLQKKMLKAIFKIEKNPTAKLDILVFCKPTNKPVIIYNVNSPGAE